MRASVTSLSKKLISTFFAVTLALGLVPAMAFATEDDNAAAMIPAGEVINQVEPLEVVARQESTKSYFLAQTLEDTRTVPVVSANLPLDKGMVDDAAMGDDGEAPDTEASEQLPAIAIESVVVGSFEQGGLVYAIEPGGDSVAVVATDYAKLSLEVVESHTLEIPFMATSDGIDYYSVTRMADNAFAGLASKTGLQQDQAADENVSIGTDSASAISDEPDAVEEGATSEMSSIDIVSAVVELTDGADSEQTDVADDADAIMTLVIPASVTTIEDDAFAGFTTLQYIVVSSDNPNYSSYDGCLYTADLTSLLLIPEGRTGAVRIASSVTIDDSEVFSHCPSGVTLVADADGAASATPGELDIRNEEMEFVEEIETDESLFETEERSSASSASRDTKTTKIFCDKKIWRYVPTNTSFTLTENSTCTGTSGYGPNWNAHTIYYDGGSRLRIYGNHIFNTAKYENMYLGPTLANSTSQSNGSSVSGVTSVYVIQYDANGKQTAAKELTSGQSVNVSGSESQRIYLNGRVKSSITWNGNGGTPSRTKDTGILPYKTVSLPTATRDGYVFTGWYTSASGGTKVTSGSPSLPSNTATTYYAHWVSKIVATYYAAADDIYRYTYKTDATGAGVAKSTRFAPQGYIPNCCSYTFKYDGVRVVQTGYGWSDGFDVNYCVGVRTTGDWAVDGVTSAWIVRLDASGNRIDGQALTVEPLSVSGWSSIEVLINGYGAFDITWNANGGTVEDSDGDSSDYLTKTGIMPFDASVAFPTPTREGYAFKGWFTSPSDGTQVTRVGASGGTYYAQWVPKQPCPVYLVDSETPIWRNIYGGDGTTLRDVSTQVSSGYSGDVIVSSIKLVSGYVEAYGVSSDDLTDRVYRVGIQRVSDAVVDGLESAWVVWTNDDGDSCGVALGPDAVSIGGYASADVYLNGYGSFDLAWDANGGECDVTTSEGVMPYDALLDFPTPTREGYLFSGWYTEAEGGDLVQDSGPGAAIFYAHWTPILSVAVPMSVGVMVDLTGVEAQTPVYDQDGVQGYIESRSGSSLAVTRVDFEPLEGATSLFGNGKGDVYLEALVEGSASSDPDLRFALSGSAFETDKSSLDPFGLPNGIGSRKKITYRFDIPDDVLASIDRDAFNSKTTSIGRVAYTIAVAE